MLFLYLRQAAGKSGNEHARGIFGLRQLYKTLVRPLRSSVQIR